MKKEEKTIGQEFEKFIQSAVLNEHSKKNVLHLYGRKDIENFFKNEIEEAENLESLFNQLLQYPDQTLFCLPTEYRIENVWVTVNHKAPYIMVHHNERT